MWGWTLIGPRKTSKTSKTSSFHRVQIDNEQLNKQIEELFGRNFADGKSPDRPYPSLDDQPASKQLESTIKFDDKLGHHRVGLLWKGGREKAARVVNTLDSSTMALNRLKKATVRL